MHSICFVIYSLKHSNSFVDFFAVKVTYDKHRSLHPSLQSETEFDYSEVVETREKKGLSDL